MESCGGFLIRLSMANYAVWVESPVKNRGQLLFGLPGTDDSDFPMDSVGSGLGRWRLRTCLV